MFAHIFKRFDPDQPRDEKGRWSATGVSGLTEKLREKGGFTYNAVGDYFPKKGYALSVFRDREQIYENRVTAKQLREYLEKNRDLLTQKGNAVGAWFNPEESKIYLDISKVVEDEDEARKLAVANRQEAYYSLHGGETVYTRARAEKQARSTSPGHVGCGIREGSSLSKRGIGLFSHIFQ